MSLSSSRSSQVPGLPADQGLYPISVVRQLTGIEAHTLRGYERAGLLAPARTAGGSRRYSGNDVDRLRRIAMLSTGGINLEGIRRILALEEELAVLRAEVVRLTDGGGTAAPDISKPT
jgi:MerR family transcriptional regulator, heat shock protein HspR